MGLLQDWNKIAFNERADKEELRKFWDRYFVLEKGVYEQLLENPDEVVEGTVKELADKYDLEVMAMVGFLDGIQESLITPNDLDDLTEDSHVSLAFDKERLYKNMVDAQADWLYELPQWKEIFTEEQLHELYIEQKKSGTVVKEKKIYPNDPCPCGSGKKYKKCCGRNK
ncbi:MAG: SEC-C domain-containing protein [Lachnospiraceae bacterium]|nr:SEC-C domain-containing protein [Lachnospiraceae bacterium]